MRLPVLNLVGTELRKIQGLDRGNPVLEASPVPEGRIQGLGSQSETRRFSFFNELEGFLEKGE